MCIFPKPPKPPELPPAPEAPSMPERTAKAPTIGRNRTSQSGLRSRRALRRTGTSSLRIPLTSGSNLNY
tara:strand:+ start:355 stop:561 length:207 start_codon:yes stop_codon:yes gene_type:complete